MRGKIPARVVRPVTVLLATGAVLAWATASAGAVSLTPVYSNIPATLPGNVPSEAFEATSTSQFGGEVELAGPTLNTTKVSVALSSWACQSGGAEDGSCVTTPGAKFEWPVTLHIYTAGGGDSVGTQIASLTKTFKMPYRPSASPKCTGESAGGWYRKGECFHGRLFKITFTMRGVTLPSKAIISVSYNTSDYGSEPQRPKPCNATTAGCPYDSLNVGLTEPANEAKPEPVALSS